jgi:hypothetical protein
LKNHGPHDGKKIIFIQGVGRNNDLDKLHHSLTKYQPRITLHNNSITLRNNNITLHNRNTILHNYTIIPHSITRSLSIMRHGGIELAIEVEEEKEEALEESEDQWYAKIVNN